MSPLPVVQVVSDERSRFPPPPSDTVDTKPLASRCIGFACPEVEVNVSSSTLASRLRTVARGETLATWTLFPEFFRKWSRRHQTR